MRLGREPALLVLSIASALLFAAMPAFAQMQAPPPAATAPYGQPMQAGGLTPPPPMGSTPPPTSTATEQQLDDAKKEDAGRGLSWVWLNVEGGYEHVGLQTFSSSLKGATTGSPDFTAGFVPSTANGGVIGPGLGIRLLFLTIGARGRLGFFDGFQLFSIGPEIGFHIPLGNLEPHLEIGAGYTAMGSFKGAVSGASDAISIHGFDARIGGGLDYFITPVVSIGANVSWELLGLTRPGVDPAKIAAIKSDPSVTSAQSAQADALALQGSAYGSALAITGVVGLHF